MWLAHLKEPQTDQWWCTTVTLYSHCFGHDFITRLSTHQKLRFLFYDYFF